MKRWALLFACGIVAGAAQAQVTRYITDQLEVTLRTGQSTQHAIKRMLTSGTPVEVVSSDKDSGYSRIRTRDGVEGWVLTRYLMSEAAPRERVTQLESRLTALSQENRQLKQDIAALTAERDTVTKTHAQQDEDNRRLTQELAQIRRASADVLGIDAENQQLKGRVASLERELLTLQEENAALGDRTQRDWFMVGAGVVVLGILLGLILPKIRWRRKPRWDVL